MEEVQTIKLNIEQIKQIIFKYHNIDINSKFEVKISPLEDADISFHITTKKKVSSLEVEIENVKIVTQDDLNNILEKIINKEGLTISNYRYNKNGNHDFKLITYNLKKKEKVKQKTLGGNKNV